MAARCSPPTRTPTSPLTASTTPSPTRLGLRDTTPLRAWPTEPSDKIVTFVPPSHAEAVIDALRDAGAGTLGDYTRCAWTVDGTGTFTPGEGATPHIGEVGRVEVTPEVAGRDAGPASPASLRTGRRTRGAPLRRGGHRRRSSSPRAASGTGLGRVGTLTTPMSLRQFAGHVAKALPATPAGRALLRGPRSAGRAGGGLRRSGGLAAAGRPTGRCRRLRHGRPAAPPRVRAPGRRRPRPDRPGALGERVALAARGRDAAPSRRWRGERRTTVETHVSTIVTDPVPVTSRPAPRRTAEGVTDRAGPPARPAGHRPDARAARAPPYAPCPRSPSCTSWRSSRQSVRGQLVAAQTEVSDIAREQDKLESDIDQVRQRMTRDQQRLDSGAVSSAKELESLQHEIGSLAKRQRDLEDVELEVMERLEDAEREPQRSTPSSSVWRLRSRTTERRRVAALDAIDKDVEFARQQRATVVPDIGDELLTLLREAAWPARRHRRRGHQAPALRRLPARAVRHRRRTHPRGGRGRRSSAARSAAGSRCAPPSPGCESWDVV